MNATSPSTVPIPPSDSTPARLNARDFRVLLLWLLAGIVGATVAYKYYFVAFPEAAVDFKISRAAALSGAHDVLAAQGHPLDAYQSSIIFSLDDTAKTYLERELGAAQANQLMASDVCAWYWHARFFRPGQKEEYFVKVGTDGRIVGMGHEIEESRASASLDESAAVAVATQFLEQRLRVPLADYDFLPAEANKTERPARRDWSFAWERRGFRAKDAPYHLEVTLLGGEVGGYREFLKVPETWQRSFQKLRSSNELYQIVDQILYFLLVGAALWMVYDFARRSMVHWRTLFKLLFVLAALFFLMDANALPIARADYDTNTSYAGFYVLRFGISLLLGLTSGVLVAIAVGAGEPLYRADQPERIRVNKLFTLPAIRSKEFFRACVIGLCLAGAHLGFVVLFYMIGYRHGIWAPQDINYSDVVNTAAPWLYPLTIGLFAATNEEFFFRLFAIPFLLRLTKSRVAAVILPAFIWGFLHSVYPQEPGYTRGIEVGLIGIVAGIVMLRWGILATLVWHYTVDAFLISTILLRSGSLYFRVSGAIVGGAALIPLAISGVSYITRRRFDVDPAILNSTPEIAEAAPPPVAETPRAEAAGYQPLAARALWAIVACGALGAVLFATVKVPAIGDFVRFSTDSKQAEAIADEAMRQRSPAAAQAVAWHHTVTLAPVTDPVVNEYLRRQIGIAAANEIYKNEAPPLFWRVRYFRDSQKEEYAVVIRPDGALHAIHHDLDERTPGANLTKDEAQARAEAFLRDTKKMNLAAWRLAEAKSEQNPKHTRTDHTFEWERLQTIGAPSPGYKDGAHVRVQLRVLGDELAGYRTFIKIPDEWYRKETEDTLPAILYLVLLVALIVAFVVVVLVIYFRNLKDPAANLPWRRFARWAAWGVAAYLVAWFNGLNDTLSRYPSAWPLKGYVVLMAIGLLLGSGIVLSGLMFLFGLARFFLSKAFGSEHLPGWRGMPASYYRQAFWLGLGGAGVLLGFYRLTYFVQRVWPTPGGGLDATVPAMLASWLPASAAAASAVMSALFLCGIIGLAGGFVARYARQPWMQAGLILLVTVARVGEWGSPADYLKKLILNLAFVALVWFGVSRLIRFNLLAYFLLLATLTLTQISLQFLTQPNSFYHANGIATLAVLAALLAWPLVSARGAGEAPASAPPQ